MTNDVQYQLEQRIAILSEALEAAERYIADLEQKIKDMEAAGMISGRPLEVNNAE